MDHGAIMDHHGSWMMDGMMKKIRKREQKDPKKLLFHQKIFLPIFLILNESGKLRCYTLWAADQLECVVR